MPYVYIGKTTYQIGKPLWEILSNLKNFGVGRMIIRGTYQRYKDPCYYRILEVEAMAAEGDVRRVKALVDTVFRGKYYGQEHLCMTTYKPDFQLVPKREEGRISGITTGELPPGVSVDATMPAFGPLPPLLRELVIQGLEESGKPVVEPQMRMQYIMHANSKFRIAEEGETPTVTLTNSIRPVKPEMYSKIKK